MKETVTVRKVASLGEHTHFFNLELLRGERWERRYRERVVMVTSISRTHAPREQTAR